MAVRMIEPQLPIFNAFCTAAVLLPAASLILTNKVPTIENNIPSAAISIGSKIGARPPNASSAAVVSLPKHHRSQAQ